LEKIKNSRFQTGKVILVSVAHFFHDVYTAFLAPLIPLLREHLHFSLAFAGTLNVVQRLPMLLNPLVGILAERSKARYFVIVAPAVTTVAMSLLGVAPSKAFLVLLVLVSGISSAFFHVPSPVMIRKVAGSRMGRGMSFFMVGGELARTLGPILVTGAVEVWGLKGTLHLMPVGLLSSAILWYKFRHESIREGIGKSNSYEYLRTMRQIFPLISSIAMIFFFRAAMKSALTFYLPVFLVDQGKSTVFAGVSLSVLQGAGVLGTLVAGNLADRFGQKRILVLTTVLTPLLMLCFLYSTGVLQMICLMLTGFILFFTGPVFLSIINQVKTKHHNLVNGVYMTTTFMIGAIMVTVVGFMGDALTLEETFHYVAFVAFGAIPFAIRMKF
jgi:FSR family fosmidomycin resistance protein-like MFS transporter